MKHLIVTIFALSLLFLPTSVQAEELLMSKVQGQRQAEEIQPANIKANLVVIEKAARRLTLFDGRRAIKTYKIALGKKPIGAKYKRGDKRTPEGFYTIDRRDPDSRFHRSLHVSYPNDRDVEIAKLLRVPAGSGILIHGVTKDYEWMGRYHAALNWTDGCIAVTNEEIEEIWELVADGTELQIKP